MSLYSRGLQVEWQFKNLAVCLLATTRLDSAVDDCVILYSSLSVFASAHLLSILLSDPSLTFSPYYTSLSVTVIPLFCHLEQSLVSYRSPPVALAPQSTTLTGCVLILTHLSWRTLCSLSRTV